jgi:phage terminase large subunit
MQKHGYPNMRRAVKGPGSVEDGIEFLKNYDIVIHPDCIHTIDEYKLYSYKIDKKTQKVTTDLEDKNNHCIDADRYAVENVRRHPPTVIVGTYRGT